MVDAAEATTREAHMGSYLLVGVDGSPPSLAAARYAASWAVRSGGELHLLHSYPHTLGAGVGTVPFVPAASPPPRSGEEMLRRVADALKAGQPGLTTVVQQVAGGAPAALVDQSRWADLTVVGSRGATPVAALALGSVASIVAAYAHSPVLVVRPPARLPGPDDPVLVGVDGSDHAAPALELAFEAAARFGAPLTALHVWWAQPNDSLKRRGIHVPAAAEAEANGLLHAMVEPWREKYPYVDVQERLVHGLNPAEKLIDASGGAALTVVGSRGRGGFVGLLLGSVGQSVVQRAHSPVAIARSRTHERM
jgi:nucleotide-binding universal stress UspA family protein